MKLRLLACSMLLASSSVTFAGEGETTLNLGTGVMVFDDDRNLDNGTIGSIGLEYGFTENVAAEISFLQTSPDLDSGDGHVDVREIRLDGLYYFLSEGRWLPYAAMGAGTGKFSYDTGSFTENQVNLGGGIRFIANETLSLRVDLRGIYGDEDNDTDAALTVGMSWTFGDGNAIGAKRHASAPTPVRQPAPVDKDIVKEVALKPAEKIDTASIEPVIQPVVKTAEAIKSAIVAVDSDGDGVIDAKDQCPNTAKGVKVTGTGCKIKTVTVETIELDIKFPTNSSDVRAEYMSELKKVSDFLNKHADLVVDIEGHSDSRGKASYNKWLSQRRATSVKAAIVNQFAIDAKRINAIGYGEEKPVASNDTVGGRQKNRRVIAVMQKEVIE
ncbi:hypothetical protein A9Q81_18325 [Gammaproteobacteria bacterium 42_54_T18]|nr:hypothetical protein A9Q81_18325 [Gammaproteobacteria bacterium 42_54_T18]